MTHITIISGFLGAGKTTFANLLLDYYIRSGEKTAYVVNEFGQTGLDSALLRDKGFQTVDIFGGCICCTLRGKITEALREIIGEHRPTRIVFEPSGIFIFEKFLDVLKDPFLEEHCKIDSVITIVDSNHLTEAMFVPGNFFANQVAHADTLILSKLESYEGDVAAMAQRLSGLNQQANVIAKPWSALRDKDFAALVRGGSDGVSADGEHAHHGHAKMDTVTFEAKALDEASLNELAQLVKDDFFGEIYRIKGKILYCGEQKLLQAAFDSLKLEDNPPENSNGLTFIGNHLDEVRIKAFWA